MISLYSVENLTLALVLITGVYAWLTYSISQSNKLMVDRIGDQIEHQSRPVISVNISSRHRTVISLVVANRGNSNASDIQIRLDRPFYRFGELGEGRNLQTYNAFSRTISGLAAGDTLIFDLAQGFNINKIVDGDNITPSEFVVSVTYKGFGKTYDEKTHIDIKPYFESFAGEFEVEELIKIKDQLNSISTSLAKIASK